MFILAATESMQRAAPEVQRYRYVLPVTAAWEPPPIGIALDRAAREG
jgi:hypothetical protein